MSDEITDPQSRRILDRAIETLIVGYSYDQRGAIKSVVEMCYKLGKIDGAQEALERRLSKLEKAA